MVLRSTYSRRKRQAQTTDDVYNYDQIPIRVRIQVVQILSEGIGKTYYYSSGNLSKAARIYDLLCREMSKELGVHSLHSAQPHDNRRAFLGWLESEPDTDNWLDGLELALQHIDGLVRNNLDELRYDVERKPDAVIAELNARLQEAALGYEYVGGVIIRKD